MNFLKPILVGTFAFFALTMNAQTQQASATSAVVSLYAHDNIDELTTELSLTTDQVAQVESLNEKVIQKIQTIQGDSQMDAPKKKEFIRGNREDHRRTMSTILTANQFASYQEMMKSKASDRTETRMKVQDVEKY